MSTLPSKPEPSPSASPVSASYPTMRRENYYEEGPFLSTSPAGSGSGNDGFSHPPGYDGMTPSPPPPSSGMHYQPVNYNQPLPSDARSAYGGHPSASQFYSLAPSHHGLTQPTAHQLPTNGHGVQPTRLDTFVAYHSRLSPMMSPASPASNPPLSAGLSGASYEREKRHERDTDHLMMAQVPLGPEQAYRMGKPPGYMTRDGPF